MKARPPKKNMMGADLAPKIPSNSSGLAPTEKIVQSPARAIAIISVLAAPAPAVVVITAPPIAWRADRIPAIPAVLIAG